LQKIQKWMHIYLFCKVEVAKWGDSYFMILSRNNWLSIIMLALHLKDMILRRGLITGAKIVNYFELSKK